MQVKKWKVTLQCTFKSRFRNPNKNMTPDFDKAQYNSIYY